MPAVTTETAPLSELLESWHRQASRGADDRDRCVEDFRYYCVNYVQTVYTDPATEERSYRFYPDYPYLDEYAAAIALPGLLVVPKSREMIATTHPLVVSLHHCYTVWRRGGIWRTAIIRQNKAHANELIARIRGTWERLPDALRPPLDIDNIDRLTFAGGGTIQALPEEGETGRGEDWDLVILDEGAFQQHLAANIGAFAPRSRTIVVPSTFNGEGNTFARLVDGIDYPGRRVFAMPYSIHPHRQPGTPECEAYLALNRAKMSVADFKREIEMCRDVYAREGYYGSDWNPAVIREVAWDGKGIITIGMDYSYLHPAAVVSYVNEHGQWCRMREYLERETALERFCQLVFDDCLRRYPAARYRVAPDPFRGRQTKGDVDNYGNPATDIATTERMARQILGADTLTSITQTGNMLRAEGHRRVRRGFALREDNRFGTIIDPSCRLLIQGFSGAYGPRDAATPRELELEEADPDRIQIHVMDADRYAFCEFTVADKGLDYDMSDANAVDWDMIQLAQAQTAARRAQLGI